MVLNSNNFFFKHSILTLIWVVWDTAIFVYMHGAVRCPKTQVTICIILVHICFNCIFVINRGTHLLQFIAKWSLKDRFIIHWAVAQWGNDDYIWLNIYASFFLCLLWFKLLCIFLIVIDRGPFKVMFLPLGVACWSK